MALDSTSDCLASGLLATQACSDASSSARVRAPWRQATRTGLSVGCPGLPGGGCGVLRDRGPVSGVTPGEGAGGSWRWTRSSLGIVVPPLYCTRPNPPEFAWFAATQP
jgi:hypothetical protein